MQYMFENKGKWLKQITEDEPNIIKGPDGKYCLNPKANFKIDNKSFEALARKVLAGTQAMKKSNSLSAVGYTVVIYANSYFSTSDLSEAQKRLNNKAKASLSSNNTKIEITFNK